MARILDMGSDWKLIIDDNVNPVEEINKPEEGYIALIGENKDTGLHTISYVMYHKEYTDLDGNYASRSVDDILQKVDDLKNCERCSTLDKEKLNVDSIDFQSHDSSGFVTQQKSVVDNINNQPIIPSTPPPQSTGSPINDMFAGVVVDALLTDPGKYFLGTVLGDEKLVGSAIKNKKPTEFAEEMLDFMEGKTDIIRSSDEAHDFLSMVRESNQSNSTTPTQRRRPNTGPRTVIW